MFGAGKDCRWFATAGTEEVLMEKTIQHIKEGYKEIELTPETLTSLKSLIKEI